MQAGRPGSPGPPSQVLSHQSGTGGRLPACATRPGLSGLAVVTGATGHLGNVLVRELVDSGRRVRAVILPGEDSSPLSGFACDRAEGDVRDPDAMRRAFEDARIVFHLAGVVTIESGKARLLDEVNVRGTANVCRACRAAGVRRLVYSSSVHALEEPAEGVPVRETDEFRPGVLLGDYARSKAKASIVVREAAGHGLDAVTVFPSGIIGPHDYKPSEMGQLFLEFGSGRLRAYVDGAYDFVDVRDAAHGLLLAAERGRGGQGYILSGNRVTVREMFSELSRQTGVKAPGLRLPRGLALAAGALSPLYARLTGKRPLFTSYSVRVLGSNCLMDRGKAARELGYRPRPFSETLRDTIRWFVRTGRLRPAAGQEPGRATRQAAL